MSLAPVSKRWRLHDSITPDAENALVAYPTLVRQILFNRGIASAEAARTYLEARQPPGTDPLNLLGMPAAVDRILHAIRNHESIAVYGDYDADGVTATALLKLYLGSLGSQVTGYIPNRFDEGYGLNAEALDTLKADGISLVITVDCGIRSIEEAHHAREIGLDLIISDHHHPGAELPKAVSVINPRQEGDPYPEKDLAGVGLAYKILQAINAHLEGSELDCLPYLDLVALGTVADLAPLAGENRYLVRQGLEYLRRPHRQGIQSLIGAAGLQAHRLTATDIGFGLGPRINAAGRLDSAYMALDLLTTTSPQEAGTWAQILDNQNRERQKITRQIQEKAVELALEKDPESALLVAYDPDFNSGVVGLAASRLTDQFYRPAIVGQVGEHETRASCRSIPEFHITQALDQCADLLEHHGGHAAAAGFTVLNDKLPALNQRLNDLAREALAGKDLRPTLMADVETPLSALQPELIQYLDQLQPTGYGNPRAVFISRDLLVRDHRTVGRDQSHLKLSVSDGWITFDAIAFRLGHWNQNMPRRVDLAFNFEVNEFRGQQTLQLNVLDLKPAGSPD
jgi:single-stranded-DNA-specific exonuclease